MGTLLKYLLYALIIIVIYLIGVGFYEGRFNSNTTIGEVSGDVAQGTKQIIKDGYNSTKEALGNGYDTVKESDTVNSIKESVSDGYDATVDAVQDGYQATKEGVKKGYNATVDTVSDTYNNVANDNNRGGFRPGTSPNAAQRGGFQAQ